MQLFRFRFPLISLLFNPLLSSIQPSISFFRQDIILVLAYKKSEIFKKKKATNRDIEDRSLKKNYKFDTM